MLTTTEDTQAKLLRATYDIGKTAIYSAKVDPRFQYCLYVPPQIGPDTELVVCVHGTSRTSFLDFRDGFAEFGRWNDCIILCPIFPSARLGTARGVVTSTCRRVTSGTTASFSA